MVLFSALRCSLLFSDELLSAHVRAELRRSKWPQASMKNAERFKQEIAIMKMMDRWGRGSRGSGPLQSSSVDHLREP